MKLTLRVSILVLCLSLPSAVLAAPTYWELEPVATPRMPGKWTVIKGKTSEQGVFFTIKNLDVKSPVQIVLATESNIPLELAASKERSGKTLWEGKTVDGMALARFRTGGSVHLCVKGPIRTAYQLAVWVGPPVGKAAPPAVVSMKSFLGKTGTPAAMSVPAASAPGATPPAVAAATPAPGFSFTHVLLTGIFVVLVVIAFLLLRKGKNGGVGIVLAVSLSVSPLQGQEGTEFMPEVVKNEGDEMKRISQALHQIRDRLKQIDASGTLAADSVKALPLMIAFMEEFGMIDPREAAVEPDFSPNGMPALPSHYLDDVMASPEKTECFKNCQEKIDQARKHLENNYAVFRETELKTGRIYELADAATGLSPYAKLLWTAEKSNPNEAMNKSKERFYAKYDEGQKNGLNYLNDALKEMSACEQKHYGEANWYLYFGLPYYNFMVARYTRKDAR
ncbi:MAG: hypothetical protein SFY92_11955 [Verrucomicrobiae bacterium]|nr:hypothetical protein [Verrucomicrobiae bacterium]